MGDGLSTIPRPSEQPRLIRISTTLPGFHFGHTALVPTEIRCDVMLHFATGEPLPDLTEDFRCVGCATTARRNVLHWVQPFVATLVVDAALFLWE